MRKLPSNIDAERYVLGSILLDQDWYPLASGILQKEDFSLEKHRKIFIRMGEIYNRGEKIDRITVANELMKFGELESVDGVGYLVSLDDGMPRIANLEGYVNIVKEKSTLRRIIYVTENYQNRAMLGEETSDELVAGFSESIRAILDGTNPGEAYTFEEIIHNYPGGIEAFLNPPRGGAGVPTPWNMLTENLAGLNEGELFLLGGRPSMGKSLVAMDIGYHAAKLGHGVLVFSMEMSKEMIVKRKIAAIAMVDFKKFQTGYLSADERKRMAHAIAEFNSLPLRVDEKARTVQAIRGRLHRSSKIQPRIIVIDHLQLIKSSSKNYNKHEQISEISHELKHLSKDFKATVILVSQLNRECEKENRRPSLSDLRESGTIEEDADVVMFVHRPERYIKNHGKPEFRGTAEFLIAKQRNGPIGKIRMVFLDKYQKFEMSADNRYEALSYDTEAD